MKIKIWGCRGSLPTPLKGEQYKKKIRSIIKLIKPEHLESDKKKDQFINSLPFYLKNLAGGNTTCIEIRDKNNNVVIIDTGSGARELGLSLLKEMPENNENEYNILYSHTHWDHICGLMFFPPIYIPGVKLNFWSKFDNLKERLETQQNPQFFPLEFKYMSSDKTFNQIQSGETINIHNLKITAMDMNHPGGCLGYRIEEEGSVFTFCTDTEFDFDNKNECHKYCSFIKDSNLVMFDTQYLIKQINDKKKWGHSTGLTATDLCLNSNVEKLIMFHHDPSDDEQEIYNNFINLVEYKQIKNKSHKLIIQPGFEGQTFNI